MKVFEVLGRKSSDVITILPTASVNEAIAELAMRRIGALIVSQDNQAILGIISERDVVRELARQGAGVLDAPVSDIMTSAVHCCTRNHAVDDVLSLMTERRVRHVPVVDDGELMGIISIGDAVKHRIGELETQNYHLAQFVTTPW